MCGKPPHRALFHHTAHCAWTETLPACVVGPPVGAYVAEIVRMFPANTNEAGPFANAFTTTVPPAGVSTGWPPGGKMLTPLHWMSMMRFWPTGLFEATTVTCVSRPDL